MTQDILDFFEGDELATKVWIDKYAMRDKEGNLIDKHPNDTIERVAKEFHRIEKKYKNPLSYEEIYGWLKNFKYIIPAGSPLYGIGNPYSLSSLSNCYVIPSPEDSYAGILKTDEELVHLFKRRGGAGFDITPIRPKGSVVNNAANTSTGIIPFMNRYSNTTKEVAQDGRRGALMINIDVDHRDINDFIVSKDDTSKLNGCNISVKISDKFMEEKDHDKEKRDTWKLLIHQAWKTAEPGVLFWDNIIKESPADCYGEEWKTISTNPCSELPLCAYDSCRLLHVNMSSFVNVPFTDKADFNYLLYIRAVMVAQRLMDDMIDLESEKLSAIITKIRSEHNPLLDRELKLWMNIHKKLLEGRRTGLNPWLGLADCLAMLNIKYDSDEAISFCETIGRLSMSSCYESSIQMAKERSSFPIWSFYKETANPFIKRMIKTLSTDKQNDLRKYGRRNIACLTIPPAGTIAIIARCSSGIEPVFNLKYNRKRKITHKTSETSFLDKDGQWWEEYTVYHPGFLKWSKISQKTNIEDSPYYMSTAYDIAPLKKIKMIGVIQKYIDHAISQTINLPASATEEDVEKIYLYSYLNGLKGVTVYRDGCRDGVLTTEKHGTFEHHDAPKRPDDLEGEAFHMTVKSEIFTVVVGLKDNYPYEVFAYRGNGLIGKGIIHKVKKGSYVFIKDGVKTNITDNLTDEQEAITRGYSFGLRHGGDVRFAVEQLSKTKGDLTSFSKAIARVLKKFINDGAVSTERCPECNSQLVYESGCVICKNCGYSVCK